MTVRDIAREDSEFFLKSEYGPLSDFWPAVAFSNPQVKTPDRPELPGEAAISFFTQEPAGWRPKIPKTVADFLSVVRLDKTQ